MLTLLPALSLLYGCAEPPRQDIVGFERAGVIAKPATVDLGSAKQAGQPYRLIPGDLLEVQLPAIAVGQVGQDRVQTVTCRVAADGKIFLPTAGNVPAASRTPEEVEQSIVEAFFPKYVQVRPPVTVRVVEYRTFGVTISGAVRQPGLYALRSDELSVNVLVAKAGGLSPEGASEIKLSHPGGAPVVITAQNAASSPSALEAGDRVEVVAANPPVFSVLGRANRPGVFPYPSGARYTLSSAIAAAGGLEVQGEAEYATILRHDASGKTFRRHCRIDEKAPPADGQVLIRPGDVVQIERNMAAEIRQAMLQMIRVGAGANYDLAR